MNCPKCGKWAGAHATLPGQPTEHLCMCPPKTVSEEASLLEAYSKELYGDRDYGTTLTLEQLIDAHRRLRQMNVETNEYRAKACAEGYNIGHAQGMAQVNREYIKVEDLKKLTMTQVAEMLYDGE